MHLHHLDQENSALLPIGHFENHQSEKMALSKLSKYNWEKVLSKLPTVEAKRPALLLRSAVNEIVAESAKYGDKPAEVDFAAYKNKLKFTGATVDKLEALYKSRKSPGYFAQVPEFTVAKRQVTASVLERIVEARKQDIAELTAQLEGLSQLTISGETSIGDLTDRFPEISRDIESDIKTHDWAGAKN